ncbi:hypothetical protein BC828DRAFT_338841, partial [Blastocladiella britannica]
MSFVFEWPQFSQEFYAKAARELTAALNKSALPPNIASEIVVSDLDLGTVAPDLEILELSELSMDRFRGIFGIKYAGDAFITLTTAVQANPLAPDAPALSSTAAASMAGASSMVAANLPLIVPLQLKISLLKLSGIASLVVDRAKGITLAFKNDPLEAVRVSSTFDHVSNIRKMLQRQIEDLLRKLFVDDLPALVHSASRTFL